MHAFALSPSPPPFRHFHPRVVVVDAHRARPLSAVTALPDPAPDALPPPSHARKPPPAIIVPGKFDALHLGHLHLARAAAALAPPTLLSFSGMAAALKWAPRAPVVAPVDRARVLRAWSADLRAPVAWRELPFDAVRDLTPAQFLALLARRFGAAAVVCGPDWRFGRRAQGDVRLLRQLAPQHGLQVRVVEALVQAGNRSEGEGEGEGEGESESESEGESEGGGAGGGQVVSSTRVRAALEDGDVELATRLLGRRHRVVGYVRGQGGDGVMCERFVNQVPGVGMYRARVRVIGREEVTAVVQVTTVGKGWAGDERVVEVQGGEAVYCDECEVYLDFVARIA